MNMKDYLITIPLILGLGYGVFAGEPGNSGKKGKNTKANVEKVNPQKNLLGDKSLDGLTDKQKADLFKAYMEQQINNGQISSIAYDKNNLYSSTLTKIEDKIGKKDFLEFMGYLSKEDSRVTNVNALPSYITKNPWPYLVEFYELKDKQSKEIKNLNSKININDKKSNNFKEDVKEFLSGVDLGYSLMGSSFGEKGDMFTVRIPVVGLNEKGEPNKYFVTINYGLIGDESKGSYKFVDSSPMALLPDGSSPGNVDHFSKVDEQSNHKIYGAGFGANTFGNLSLAGTLHYLTGYTAKQTSDLTQGIMDGNVVFEETTKENEVKDDNAMYIGFNAGYRVGPLRLDAMVARELSSDNDWIYGAGASVSLNPLFESNHAKIDKSRNK